MSNSSTQASLPLRSHGSTAEFAARFLVRPQTVLKQLSMTGSYFGTRPEKLPNGRLRWPLV